MVKVNATMIGLLVALTLFPLFPTLASSTDNWQLALNWEYSNGGGDLVVSEGYVCFFSAQNYYGSASLVAVNASTGHGIWSIQTNGNALGDTPVIMNGLVYTSTSAYNLTDSQLVLNYSNYRGYGSPKIANGVLLITTSDATNGFGPDGLVALNALTGSQLWRFNEGRNVGGGSSHMIGFENQPPAVTNGIAYFSCASGIYAFNIQTGSQLWHQSIYAFGGIIEAGHGNVYVSLSGHYRNGTIFYKVYCMNAASGSTKWSYQTEKMETIAIGDNALYISGVALDANTGKIRWNNSLLESCSVAQGVVFSASKNSIFALNASTG